MIDFLCAILELLGLIDSRVRAQGPSRWYRRHPKLIRSVLNICWILVSAVFLIYVLQWLSILGPWVQGLVAGVIAMQVVGFLILLLRRKNLRPPPLLQAPGRFAGAVAIAPVTDFWWLARSRQRPPGPDAYSKGALQEPGWLAVPITALCDAAASTCPEGRCSRL